MDRAELERAAELTRRAGAWLVMDNTYGVLCATDARMCLRTQRSLKAVLIRPCWDVAI